MNLSKIREAISILDTMDYSGFCNDSWLRFYFVENGFYYSIKFTLFENKEYNLKAFVAKITATQEVVDSGLKLVKDKEILCEYSANDDTKGGCLLVEFDKMIEKFNNVIKGYQNEKDK